MTRDEAVSLVEALEEYLDAREEWYGDEPLPNSEEVFERCRGRLIDRLSKVLP